MGFILLSSSGHVVYVLTYGISLSWNLKESLGCVFLFFFFGGRCKQRAKFAVFQKDGFVGFLVSKAATMEPKMNYEDMKKIDLI